MIRRRYRREDRNFPVRLNSSARTGLDGDDREGCCRANVLLLIYFSYELNINISCKQWID